MTTEWVTVPREPTEAMVAAGRSYAVPSTQAIIPIYTAMLSACPPSPPVSGCEGNLRKRPVAFRVKDFVSGHLLFYTEDEARKCADELGCEYQGLYVRDSTPLNFSDPPAQHGVFDALQWALAEIEGRTTYENDDQRAACLARARSALSDPPVSGEVVEALRSIPDGAIEALRNNQRQLDMDGVEVGVSRQAVDEVLAAIDAAVSVVPPKGESSNEVVEALRSLLFSARLLHQNSEICIEQHHGLTPSETGWLACCLKSIERAEAVLVKLEERS